MSDNSFKRMASILLSVLVIFSFSSMVSADSLILVDKAKICNSPGGGADGADLSIVDTASGYGTYGFACSHNSDTDFYELADKFTLSNESNISRAEFYAYQTGSTTTSTITEIFVKIYDGNPMTGGNVVWGDTTTSRFLNTSFTGCYRVLDTGLENRQRPIMKITANIDQILSKGDYWISFSTKGDLPTGPWGNLVVFDEEGASGTAVQYITNSGWGNMVDDGNGVQGSIPFKLYAAEKLNQTAPASPTVKSKTDTSITLVSIAGEQYKVNEGLWQDSNIFEGLTPNEEYTFYARTAETTIYLASPESIGTKITTNKLLKGQVVDKNGNSVGVIDALVTTEESGNKNVELKADQVFLMKQANGTKSPLSDISKIGFAVEDNQNISISTDGKIEIKDLANETESIIPVTYDLENGNEIIIEYINIKVDDKGNVTITSTLVDPYGIITDISTGEVIVGANITLYYADTARNKAAGKIADTLVELPIIDGFNPNNNKNPQVSDTLGAYAFMVFPTSDYYIVVTKDKYEKYVSQTIKVENEIVKHDIEMTSIKEETLVQTGSFIDGFMLNITGILFILAGLVFIKKRT
ncbi:MAG: hypothetical protein ACERKV_08695 [Clostridiaceae bacterium]